MDLMTLLCCTNYDLMTPFSQEEIQQLRAETSGTKERIHFNNAGSSLPPDVVVDTVVDYLREEARLGGYEMADKYKEPLNLVYSQLARLINADTDEIALAENASIAWGLAFNGITFQKGDVVLASEFEYVTNLLGFLQAEKTHGIEIRVIPNDEQGRFSLSALEAAISPRTKLIAVTHIASTAGGILPVEEIGKIARKHHILYLVDACQSVGHVPVDVKAIDCDMLSVTGRKYLRAPRGTGFLYVRKAIQDKLQVLFMDGFSTEWVNEQDYKLKSNARRFELFEKNKALVLGLGKAAEYALQVGPERAWLRIQQLAASMRRQLFAIDGITLHDFEHEQSGIVTFSVKDMPCETVQSRLAEKRINVSIGFAKSTLYYMNKHQLGNVMRASVHYFNTEEEIAALCETLRNMI